MFNYETSFPIAVASHDDEALRTAIGWCAAHMEDGDRVTVWTRQKQNLGHNRILSRYVDGYRDVDHVTARGGSYVRGSGPVLMAWPDPADIGEFLTWNHNKVRALCVIAWDADTIRPWVTQVKPAILGDTSLWDHLSPALDPVVEEALRSLTMTVNHNNTISAGYEKDQVVGSFLALHDAGYRLEGDLLSGWAVANGWSGNNARRLQDYAERIEGGARPRTRNSKGPKVVDYYRKKAAERAAGELVD